MAGLRGAERDVQGLRRFIERQIQVIDEDEQGALLDRELAEPPLELVARGERAFAIVDGRTVLG
jgi:hypothetical protein